MQGNLDDKPCGSLVRGWREPIGHIGPLGPMLFVVCCNCQHRVTHLLSGMRHHSKAALNKILEEAPEVAVPAVELEAAIKFVNENEGEARRKVQLSHNYFVQKAHRNLMNGGFPRTYGLRIAKFMHNLDSPDVAPPIEVPTQCKRGRDVFDHERAFFFGPLGDAPEDSPAGRIQTLTTKETATIEKKAGDVLKTMSRRKWKNGMVRCDFVLQEKLGLGIPDEEEYLSDAGASPWIVGIGANTWRHGPSDITMPGFPQILVTMDSHIILSLMALAPLLSQGLMPADLKTFLNTPTGEEFAKDHSSVIVIPPKSAIYLPAGLIPVATFIMMAKQEPTPRAPNM